MGPRHTAWCIDDDGLACFMRGVTRSKPTGDGHWWQVPLAQQVTTKETSLLGSIKDVSMSINTLWSKGGHKRHDALKLVAVSHSGVCGMTTHSYVHTCAGGLAGARYKPATAFGLSHSVHMVDVGSLRDKTGAIWLVRPNLEMFCMERGHHPVSVEPPDLSGSELKQISASSLNIAVWLLAVDGGLYERTGVSRFCPRGTGWKPVDMTGVRSRIVSISCGGYTMFASDTKGDVWFRFTSEDAPYQQKLTWLLIQRPAGEKLVKVSAFGVSLSK